MSKEVERLAGCLKKMRKCLKVPHFQSCICFADAFRVFKREIDELDKNMVQLDGHSKDKFLSLKKEIEEITKIISKGNKECLGCSPCLAELVFKSYPERLNQIYLEEGL